MRRFACAVFMFWTGIGIAAGQDSATLLQSFQHNFDRGATDVKVKVLNDSLQYSASDMAPLYLGALDFVLKSYASLKDDPSGKDLAATAVRLAGATHQAEAGAPLWQLFTEDADTTVRVEALEALAQLKPRDATLVAKINEWLATQVNLHESGSQGDLQVLAACAQALGSFADPTSYPVLFSVSLEGFSPDVTKAASDAMASIKAPLGDLLIGVIRNNKVSDKNAALTQAMQSPALSSDDKGAIATVALDVALSTAISTGSQQQGLIQLRFAAVTDVSSLKWAPATNLVIRSFDRALDEYSRGILSIGDLLSSIVALGSMNTHEAAVRLSLCLDLINTYKAKGQPLSDQIVLAVINNLVRLGDRVALDNLLYTQYLGYSESIQKAAREAVKNLTAPN